MVARNFRPSPRIPDSRPQSLADTPNLRRLPRILGRSPRFLNGSPRRILVFPRILQCSPDRFSFPPISGGFPGPFLVLPRFLQSFPDAFWSSPEFYGVPPISVARQLPDNLLSRNYLGIKRLFFAVFPAWQRWSVFPDGFQARKDKLLTIFAKEFRYAGRHFVLR